MSSWPSFLDRRYRIPLCLAAIMLSACGYNSRDTDGIGQPTDTAIATAIAGVADEDEDDAPSPEQADGTTGDASNASPDEGENSRDAGDDTNSGPSANDLGSVRDPGTVPGDDSDGNENDDSDGTEESTTGEDSANDGSSGDGSGPEDDSGEPDDGSESSNQDSSETSGGGEDSDDDTTTPEDDEGSTDGDSEDAGDPSGDSEGESEGSDTESESSDGESEGSDGESETSGGDGSESEGSDGESEGSDDDSGDAGDESGDDPYDCSDITIVYRDFPPRHVDFGCHMHGDGAYPGLVEDQLGDDRTPRLAANPPSPPPGYSGSEVQITSEDSFAQWYHDSEDTVTIVDELILTETAPDSGVYSFASDAFYPLTDRGLGNNVTPNWNERTFPDRNAAFTSEIHTKFVYETGQVFTFIGDDDVWVFIDDQLVVDLGGLHPQVTGSIELDTLDLIPGQLYDLDVFHAERCGSGSNFRIDTSIRCFVLE